ncbi:Rx, N-terminal [Dillenia turbinata]|uniref:Rx, N-terminal n=1 Tax=Dillenia turbinata TaxID=194707 RepID=A0AAN8VPN8_9MAGN
MGEPLLAAPLQTLLDKLVPLLNFAHLKEFRSELRTWKSKLLQLRLVLCDAEQKQLGDPQVKKWLDNLRDLAYDVDDVLEELRHEALQRQNNSSSSDSAASSSQVQDLLAQMQEITTSFLDIEADKSDLRLEERPGVRSSIIITNRLPTTSLVDSSQIVGREKEIDAILKLLGIGETTKAEENQNRVGKVEDVENALVINLMNKKNIEELKFEWERNLDNTENAESQVQILNLLEPPKMLGNLVIKGYSGVTLPNWIGDSSYSKLVELSLINWIGESFGSDVLPSTLKKLFIWNCRNLESISEMLLGPTSLDYRCGLLSISSTRVSISASSHSNLSHHPRSPKFEVTVIFCLLAKQIWGCPKLQSLLIVALPPLFGYTNFSILVLVRDVNSPVVRAEPLRFIKVGDHCIALRISKEQIALAQGL